MFARVIRTRRTDHAIENASDERLKALNKFRRFSGNHEDFIAYNRAFHTALAHASGLAVRPWAFSFDGLGGHGHIVVEVFDRQRGRWIMLDIFNNVIPVDRRSGQPPQCPTRRHRFTLQPSQALIDGEAQADQTR